MLPTPFAERVLDLVATIPPGRVLTYGDVAERLGSRAPRAVGTTLARFGGGVPWWRVVRAGGFLAPGHEVSATEHLLAEGVEVLRDRARTAPAWTCDAPPLAAPPPGD